MAAKKSHFPTFVSTFASTIKSGITISPSAVPVIIRVICVVAAVLVPTALALRGSWSIGTGVVSAQSQDNEKTKNQEIRGETRALSDQILGAIETIKLQAVASLNQKTLQSDLNDGSIIGAAELTRGTYLPAFLRSEIAAEIPRISERDIKNSGFSLFPASIKTAEDGNTLGLAFELNSRKFLVIINPLIAFNGVVSWSNGKEGERLRGYMIDNRGHVLVHSEKTFDGADFSKQDIFQKAIDPVFRGQRQGGIGFFAGARSSYVRLRSLPYAVVTERVLHNGVMIQSAGQRLNSILRDLKAPLVSMLSVVVLACFGAIFIILSAFGELPQLRRVSKTQSKSDDAVLSYYTAEQLKRAEAEFAEKTKEIEFLRNTVKRSGAKTDPDAPTRKPS